jgi:hypothetical protein
MEAIYERLPDSRPRFPAAPDRLVSALPRRHLQPAMTQYFIYGFLIGLLVYWLLSMLPT